MAKNESKAINKKEKKETKNKKDKTSFFKSFKAELKKVSWPTPKQLVNNTVAVIVVVLILSALVFVLDLAFESMNKYGIDKVKESIVSTKNETTENQTEEENEQTTEPTETIEETESTESTETQESSEQ